MDHAQAALTQRWLPVLNTESNIIPAHGAMELAGITYDADNGRIVYQVKRPTSDDMTGVLFNSWEPIAASGYGAGTMDFPCVGAYTGTAPAVGDSIGTTVSSYLLTGGNSGHLVVSDITAKTDLAVISGAAIAYKQLVKFSLDAALTTAESFELATIEDQYGPGKDHPTGTAIKVWNMEVSTASTYLFEGDSGDFGLALFHRDNGTNLEFVIIQMECP